MGDVREQPMSDLPRGSIFALLLIAAGAALFLDNTGILPIAHIGAYWPIFIVFWGATMLERWRNPVSVIWAFALMGWGVLLILGNLHILPITGGVFWAIALIAAGVTMLVRPVEFREWGEKMRAHHQEQRERNEKRRVEFREWREKRRMEAFGGHGTHSEYAGFTVGRTIFGHKLRETVVFGSLTRRVQTQQFEGGKVEAVFGSIALDLVEAAIPGPDYTAILKVDAVFGGVEITAPRNWRIVMKAAAVMGGCNDRTIPPRPEPGVEMPTLVVTGSAVFGNVEIRN